MKGKEKVTRLQAFVEIVFLSIHPLCSTEKRANG